MRKVLTVMLRPFQMFVTEPIVLFLSLLSGFSDALIFTFLDSYKAVFQQWNFGPVEIGLAFIPLVAPLLSLVPTNPNVDFSLVTCWPSFPSFRYTNDNETLSERGVRAL